MSLKLSAPNQQDATEERNEIFGKLEELKQALVSLHPSMPILLQKIHKQLKADPAIVTIMSEEDISVIFQALEKHTNTTLMEVSVKKLPKKKGSELTEDDL
jgi:methionyl-tRNA synthetase